MNSKSKEWIKCLKENRNWSGEIDANTKFDSVNYNKTGLFKNANVTDLDMKTVYTRKNLHLRSPKLLALAKTIFKLDTHDIQTHGHTFKHFIFSNTRNDYGAKLVASALQTMLSIKHIMEVRNIDGSEVVAVGQGGSNHYGLLTMASVMKRPYEKDFKTKLLQKFNSPENAHGNHMRFIIVDHAYKQGITLKNVKYVHLFEPLPTKSQEKQAVARAIRFCSHEHTDFVEDEGWKVQVHIYKLFTPENKVLKVFDPATNTYTSRTNVDIDQLIYALESSHDSRFLSFLTDLIETTGPALAVDFSLTSKLIPKAVDQEATIQAYVDEIYAEPLSSRAKFVAETYQKYTIKSPEKVNNCLFTNTYLTSFQKYLANFFISKNARLGMLLWHSPGSGKTCSALHIAKTMLDHGYLNSKIIWTTTTALAQEGIECALKDLDNVVPNRIDVVQGKTVARAIGSAISYKDLGEYLKRYSQKNALLIVDEAHLLVSDEVDAKERITSRQLQNIRIGIRNRWLKPTEFPLRVLFLTATPVANPVHFFRLMNILREPNADPEYLPDTLLKIEERYGSDPEHFDLLLLRKDLDGYISYLDTMMDVSRYAQRTEPVVHKVHISMRDKSSEEMQILQLSKVIKKAEDKIKSTLKKYLGELKKTTKKKATFESDFLRDMALHGNSYFDNKTEKDKMIKKRFTLKLSKDNSQETSFGKCGMLELEEDESAREVLQEAKTKEAEATVV
jgi:hypothetical protein